MNRNSQSMRKSPLALITGGAGFIGSHLTALLLRHGWRVRVLDNFSTGRQGNLPTHDPMLEIHSGDIRNDEVVGQACLGVEVVFHLAALVSVQQCIRSPLLAEEINTRGTERIFATATRLGIRRVVFSSSCAVYGGTAEGLHHEGLLPAPASPYATTKLAGENLAARYTGAETSIVCLRYFNVYGPRQSAASDYAAVIPRFINAAQFRRPAIIYGDGGQTRDFVFVGDVALANLRAAQVLLRPSSPAVFNVGTGHATSVNDLWSEVARHFPVSLAPVCQPARPGEVRMSRADISRASQHLGFNAATSLAGGLRATIAALPTITSSS